MLIFKTGQANYGYINARLIFEFPCLAHGLSTKTHCQDLGLTKNYMSSLCLTIKRTWQNTCWPYQDLKNIMSRPWTDQMRMWSPYANYVKTRGWPQQHKGRNWGWARQNNIKTSRPLAEHINIIWGIWNERNNSLSRPF